MSHFRSLTLYGLEAQLVDSHALYDLASVTRFLYYRH
jgi:hypothetical protein